MAPLGSLFGRNKARGYKAPPVISTPVLLDPHRTFGFELVPRTVPHTPAVVPHSSSSQAERSESSQSKDSDTLVSPDHLVAQQSTIVRRKRVIPYRPAPRPPSPTAPTVATTEAPNTSSTPAHNTSSTRPSILTFSSSVAPDPATAATSTPARMSMRPLSKVSPPGRRVSGNRHASASKRQSQLAALAVARQASTRRAHITNPKQSHFTTNLSHKRGGPVQHKVKRRVLPERFPADGGVHPTTIRKPIKKIVWLRSTDAHGNESVLRVECVNSSRQVKPKKYDHYFSKPRVHPERRREVLKRYNMIRDLEAKRTAGQFLVCFSLSKEDLTEGVEREDVATPGCNTNGEMEFTPVRAPIRFSKLPPPPRPRSSPPHIGRINSKPPQIGRLFSKTLEPLMPELFSQLSETSETGHGGDPGDGASLHRVSDHSVARPVARKFDLKAFERLIGRASSPASDSHESFVPAVTARNPPAFKPQMVVVTDGPSSWNVETGNTEHAQGRASDPLSDPPSAVTTRTSNQFEFDMGVEGIDFEYRQPRPGTHTASEPTRDGDSSTEVPDRNWYDTSLAREIFGDAANEKDDSAVELLESAVEMLQSRWSDDEDDDERRAVPSVAKPLEHIREDSECEVITFDGGRGGRGGLDMSAISSDSAYSEDKRMDQVEMYFATKRRAGAVEPSTPDKRPASRAATPDKTTDTHKDIPDKIHVEPVVVNAMFTRLPSETSSSTSSPLIEGPRRASSLPGIPQSMGTPLKGNLPVYPPPPPTLPQGPPVFSPLQAAGRVRPPLPDNWLQNLAARTSSSMLPSPPQGTDSPAVAATLASSQRSSPRTPPPRPLPSPPVPSPPPPAVDLNPTVSGCQPAPLSPRRLLPPVPARRPRIDTSVVDVFTDESTYNKPPAHREGADQPASPGSTSAPARPLPQPRVSSSVASPVTTQPPASSALQADKLPSPATTVAEAPALADGTRLWPHTHISNKPSAFRPAGTRHQIYDRPHIIGASIRYVPAVLTEEMYAAAPVHALNTERNEDGSLKYPEFPFLKCKFKHPSCVYADERAMVCDFQPLMNLTHHFARGNDQRLPAYIENNFKAGGDYNVGVRMMWEYMHNVHVKGPAVAHIEATDLQREYDQYRMTGYSGSQSVISMVNGRNGSMATLSHARNGSVATLGHGRKGSVATTSTGLTPTTTNGSSNDTGGSLAARNGAVTAVSEVAGSVGRAVGGFVLRFKRGAGAGAGGDGSTSAGPSSPGPARQGA